MKKNAKGVNLPPLKLHSKIFRFMKVSLLLTLITTFNVSAVLYSQDAKLTLSVKDKSLIDVIKVIEQQSNYRFFFSDNYQDLTNRVSVNVKEGNIDKVLGELFENKAITYKVMENNIIVITPSESIVQQYTVSGTVTDATTGEPLPGVNIVVEGTTTGVISDIDGKYSITLENSSATLSFSFVGYIAQRIALGGKNVIDVKLEADVRKLDEVVVVGYGTQRKESVTGSVASMKGDEIRDVPSTNFTQALQGRVAGVEMTQTSTKPGSGMQMRIRGTRSLNATNDPLVVLDGIPFAGSVNDIDLNSIKSIDILKDASATAIYGSRGANGVILITTNRGQKGQEAKVNYNGYYGPKTLFAKYPVMDGPQFFKLRAEAQRTVAELQKGAKFDPSSDEIEGTNTDWQDLLYRTGEVNSHDLSISKGSDRGNYSFGFGYYNEKAVIPTQEYTRYSLRIAVDQEIGKLLRIGLTSNTSYGLSEGNQVGIGDALGSSPLASPYDADGNLKRSIYSSMDPYKVWTRESVEAVKDKWLSESKMLGTYNNVYGEVKIPGIEGLKYRLNLGLNYRMSQGGGFTGIGVTNATDPNAKSSASTNHALTTNWAVENMLTYDRTFAEKHQVNVVGLYSAEQTFYNRSDISVLDFPNDQFQYYNLAYGQGEKTIDKRNQGYSVSGLKSWMGRVMYSYDNRYMLMATVRSDGSSRLAPGYKWHTYPAASVGWNLGNESFMKGITQIEMLKLRVGYGQTSNQAIDPYQTLGELSTRPYNFGDNGESSYATGYYISELPNKNLGWEYTENWNFGLDFSLFKGRLSGTVEYYRQHTKDILLSVQLPSTTGVTSYMANIGETENKGFELSLNGVILNNLNGWTWEAGVNLYVNHNKLLSLTSGQDKNEGNWWFVNEPINVIFDYKRIGLWQTPNEAERKILEPDGNAGMIKVEYTGPRDANNMPTRAMGTEDRQVIQFDPEFQGGFNTRLAYKGIDLSIVGSFKRGGTLISALYGSSGYLNQLSGRHNNVAVDYWTPEDTKARYPRPGGLSAGDNPKYGSTLGYFDATYLKVRTITLGYTVNQKWIEKIGIDKLRVYFTVQNPFVLFSPYHDESGMDPETNSYGDQNQAVNTAIQRRLPIVGSNTPSTRDFLFGINLTF